VLCMQAPFLYILHDLSRGLRGEEHECTSGISFAARSLLRAPHQLRFVFGEFAAEARAARLVGVDWHCTHLLLEPTFPVNRPVNHQQLLSGLDVPRCPHIRSLCEVSNFGVERDTAVDGLLVLAGIDVPGAALDCDDLMATQTVRFADVNGLLVPP